ncbi:MAG: hydrogenase maturation nickel metallochaperone HypA [Planctomycetota bacterium]
MHELPVAENILKAVLQNAAGARAIRRIRIRVGEYSGVEPDHFEAHFKSAAAGTPAQEATLEFEMEQPAYRCRRCNKDLNLEEEPDARCPDCGAAEIDMTAGKHITLISLEIEQDA